MANPAPRACAHPGCPGLVFDGSRCPTHRKQQQQRRPNRHARGYDSTWERIRAAHLRDNPLCVRCKAATPPHIEPATVVDHIRPWLSGADPAERERLRTARSNLQSLCASCHSTKTTTEDGGFGNPRR